MCQSLQPQIYRADAARPEKEGKWTWTTPVGSHWENAFCTLLHQESLIGQRWKWPNSKCTRRPRSQKVFAILLRSLIHLLQKMIQLWYGETRTVLFSPMVPRFMTQKLWEDSTTGSFDQRLWDILDGLYPTEGEPVYVSMATGASNKGAR